jgi:hypothetical protein
MLPAFFMPTLAPAPASRQRTRLTDRASGVLAADDEFHVIENVPIFPEHTVEASDGRLLEFNYRNLAALCANCNKRIASKGDYAVICLGHSPDPELLRTGQAQTPPAVGFAGPFKMGLLGQPGYQKWCMLARFRIFKDDWAEVRKYPRRSPELWLMPTYDQMFLDPIALLGGETPRIDMGLLYSAVLSRDGLPGVLVEKYAAAAPAAGNVFVPSERYSGDPGMSPQTDEIVQGVVAALDGLDWVQWTKQKMQAEQAPAALGTAPAGDVTAPPPPAPEMGGVPAGDPSATADSAAAAAPPAVESPPATPPTAPAAAAGAAAPPASTPETSAAPPMETHEPDRKKAEVEKNSGGIPRTTYAADGNKEGEAPEGTLVDDDEDEDDIEPEPGETVEQYRGRSRDHRRRRRHSGARIKYSANGHSQDLAAVVKAALEPFAQKIDALAAEVATDRVSLKNVERYSRLEAMARQGFAIDPADMIDKLKYSANPAESVTDAEFERTLQILMKTGNRAPIDAPLVPVPDMVEQYSAQPGGGRKTASDAQRSTTKDLCEKAALDGQRPDYAATLHNVVGGKNEVVLMK